MKNELMLGTASLEALPYTFGSAPKSAEGALRAAFATVVGKNNLRIDEHKDLIKKKLKSLGVYDYAVNSVQINDTVHSVDIVAKMAEADRFTYMSSLVRTPR